jgi:hypothetical protein
VTVAPDGTPPERIERFQRRTDAIPLTTVWHARPFGVGPLLEALSLGTRRYVEARAAPGEDVTVVGRVTEAGGVDPLVVSDRSPAGTLRRMAGTSLVGLAIGAFVVALALVLLVA